MSVSWTILSRRHIPLVVVGKRVTARCFLLLVFQCLLLSVLMGCGKQGGSVAPLDQPVGTDPPATKTLDDPQLVKSRSTAESASVNPALQSDQTLHGERYETLLKRWRDDHAENVRVQNDDVRSATSALDQAIGNPVAYAEELHRLAKTYPKTDAASAYRDVAVEKPMWKPVLEWSALFQKIDTESFESLSPLTARQLIEEAKRLKDAAEIQPFASEFDEIREQVECISSRVDLFNKPIHLQLERFASSKLMARLLMIEAKNGDQYFLRNKEAITKRDQHTVIFEYIVDRELNTRRHSLPTSQVARYAAAPHSVLAHQLGTQLKSEKLLSAGWDRGFFEILNDVLRADSANSMARLDTFMMAFDVASQGSKRIQMAFHEHREILDRESPELDRVAKWFDPQDSSGRNLLIDATRILNQLKPVPNEFVFGSKAAMKQIQPAVTQWIGRLSQAVDGQWLAAGVDQSQLAGQLFVVAKDKKLIARFSPIGTLANGQLEVNSNAESLLVDGRPIFLRRPPVKPNQ